MQYRPTNEVLHEGQLLHHKAMEVRQSDPKQFEHLMAKAEYVYHQVLNRQPENASVLYLLATMDLTRGWHGMAIRLLRAAVEIAPDFGAAWNNLGIALKNEHFIPEAIIAFEEAEKTFKDDPHWADIPANLSGCYINTGEPEKALAIAERALAATPEHSQARWHKALALLEMQRWSEAWDYHEARAERGSNTTYKIRNYAKDGMTPTWDGGPIAGPYDRKPILVVHGEQGLGDEVLFASCMSDLVAAVPGVRIVLECNPRLSGLMQRSFPSVEVRGTHKIDGREWLKDGEVVAAKIALGSLPKHFRRAEPFPGQPFLVADPKRALVYRKKLNGLKKGVPNIGIAWQGGAMKTRVDLRSVQLGTLFPILTHDANFISVQYTKLAEQECAEFHEQTGIKVHHWPEAVDQEKAEDMDEQAALISELDLVITVCQTAVHIAGGLGVPTCVLVPSGPSWRYGVTGNMPWYGSVDLFRQKAGEDWTDPVIKASARVADLVASRRKAA